MKIVCKTYLNYNNSKNLLNNNELNYLIIFSDGIANVPFPIPLPNNHIPCTIKPLLQSLNINVIFVLTGNPTNSSIANCLTTDPNDILIQIQNISNINQILNPILEAVACNTPLPTYSPTYSPIDTPSNAPTPAPTFAPTDSPS